jgi:hypothetical protein
MSAPQITQPGQWSSFTEARAAMETMSLEELEETLQVRRPRLLPLALPALGVGVLLVLIAFGRLWLLPFGLALAVYGAITGGLNRTRVAQFREQCYRTYVHRRADEMQTEDESA